MTQAERPPKQLGIQSKKGGNINIERSKVNIAGGNIYNHSSVVNNPPPRSAQDKEDAQNRKELLDRAEGIWVPFLKASLFKEISLMLELHEQPDAVMNPWALVIQEINRSARVLPADTRIIQAYDDASRQLLILGEPGAGKTTLLLDLFRDLLSRARNDDSHPIPVIFNLSSWAAQQLPLASWLVQELNIMYTIQQKIGEDWIERNQILPLLDGLDEVDVRVRGRCVEAINRFRQKHGIVPTVVCCRQADYDHLLNKGKHKLQLQGAVKIQSLSREKIENYLSSLGKQLDALRVAIQGSSTLQRLASTPLMLSILMLTYHKKTVEDITSLDSFETQQNLVFQTYVSRMLQRRGTQKRYTPEQTVYWLQWLAGQLTQRSQTQFTLERMQPDWLNEHLIRWEWYGAILFGLTYFLIGIFLGWLIGNAIFGNLFGYIVGLLCGALGGYFGALYGWRNSEISPAETMKVTKVSLRETIQLPFMRGKDKGYGDFIGAMLAGAFLAQRVGGLLGLLGGLNFAILFEYAIHLLFRVKPRLLEKHLILAPNEGIHRSGRNACICGLFEGILVGIFAGLVFGGVLNGVLIGFLFAVLGWLQFGGQAYVQHYLLRWLLYNAKFTPWTYVHFLDYATERILLRKVGGSYIFIHRQLLEYFARIHISSTNNNTTKT